MPHARRGLPLSAIALLTFAVTTRAAEPLRWNFTADTVLRYRTTQTIETTIDLGSGGKETKTAVYVLDWTWTVDTVDGDGTAELFQRIDRVRLTISAPGTPNIEFDTESTDEPQGFAAMVAPLFRELAGSELIVVATARGQATEVTLPESLSAAIAAGPGAEVLGELGSAEGFKQMVARELFELPETLEPGVEWSTTGEINHSQLGKVKMTTTYRYAGARDADGATLEAFTPSVAFQATGGEAAVTVDKQETTGEVLFNRTAGRLESKTGTFTVHLTITQSDKSIKQTIALSSERTWLPEDEE
jgi:hypothetical protein